MDEMTKALPLQYEDGPDYCTVRDAQGKDFALTVQPALMKAMEAALAAQPAAPVGEFKPKLMTCGGLANEARQCFCGSECEIARQNERDELTFLRAALAAQPARCDICRQPIMPDDMVLLTHKGSYHQACLRAPPPSTKKVREDAIEECAHELETSYPDHAWLNAACAAVRSLKAAALSTNPGEQ